MFTSANKVPKHSVIQSDICIIGSGPAGLSLALEFLGRNEHVCVLEGGDVTTNAEAQSLYDLEVTGLPMSPNSRARVLGGTGTVWRGLWKEHDAIDFRARSWIPYSGWPFGRETLAPYYARAAKLFAAPQSDEYPSQGELDTKQLQSSYLFRLAKVHFDLAASHRTVLEQSKNITIYTNANVVKLEQNDGAEVTAAVVRTLDGNEFKVTANRYVLACGGIENARLLLHSRLGNENVGAFYMDHPKGVAGVLTTTKPVKWPAYWGINQGGWWMKAGLRLTDEVQAREQILNSFVTLDPGVGKFGRISEKLFGLQPKTTTIYIRNYLEQAPVQSNRVTLSEKRDRFGNPLAKVNWSLYDLDKKTMIAFHRILRDEFAARGIGDFASPLLTGENFPPLTDASHHMGTTRMGKDSRTSVVDENCKLYGIGNVFVAGSSVFSTSGYANPNATIVALAIRLADYLKVS